MKRPALLTAGMALLLLTACGTGGTGGTAPTASSDAGTEVPSEDVTLTVSYVSDPPIGTLVEGFTALYPNVTIELVQTPFADYQTSLRLALASSDAPDVVQYSPGPMRSIVPAGLVLPLDDYAELYGWFDRVSPSLLGMLTSNQEATQYGTGDLYAVPGAIQLVGVFYNKALTDAAGIQEEPGSLEQFEADVAAVADSGVVPFALPAHGVGGFQLWAALANVLGDVEVFNDWVYGVPGTSLTSDPGFTEAAALVQEWSAAGYFPADASAVADADAIAAFTEGEHAYYVTGNWNAQIFDDALGEDLGFFLVPAVTGGEVPPTTGSAFPYSISSQSANQDVAAAFLDFMMTQDASQGVFDSGFVPVIALADAPAEGVATVIQGAYEEVSAESAIAPFANWATSSMIDTLTGGVQGLLSGNLAPEAFVDSAQADWDANQP